MPAWWGKKSSKHRDDPDNNNNSLINNHKSKSSSSSSIKKSKDNNINNSNRPNRSFDEVSASIFKRNSPHTSREFLISGGGSSGFSGFESDNGLERKGHPLPLPTASSMAVMMDLGIGGAGLVSGSGSISSVSSSGSSDDQLGHDLVNFDVPRSNGEITFIRSPRSPGPGSRGLTNSTLPLHPRLSGVNLDSTTGEGRSQCHRLPLPPGSPTSPSSPALPTTRNSGVVEVSTGVLSKWKKGKLLGRGTFGHVYLGFNSESGQMCAIKEVRVVSDDPTSKECLKQLNQEINLLSQLSNPNIVQYHGSELNEETLSVYLEYVSGGSIHKLLQEYGAFKEPVIQNYTRQIVSGLAYLHGGNTVHRDIKGANILVDPNGEIKLADFGMAKHISSCTSMLSFKGSPYWMAPEVVMNTNGYSVAVDIWSLGCTILEMATSKPPWSQYEGVAAIFKIGNSRDIPEIPNHLSSDAKSFVKLCLQRDPSARPSSSQLLDHPFIRDQATTRVANINITRDAFPFTFDGSRTPTALDIQSTRKSINLCDVDYATKQGIPVSRTLNSPRYNERMITSLPVSPCSSPLRQYGPAYKSCFLSPPHPSYAISGQSSNHSSPHPMRPTAQYPFDPWQQEVPFFKSPVPEGSPRRLI